MMVEIENEEYVRANIRNCQKWNHTQQVAFSTYHDAITQICFTCDCVRTSIKRKEIKEEK